MSSDQRDVLINITRAYLYATGTTPHYFSMATTTAQQDLEAWKAYKANPNPTTRSNLLRRFHGVIFSQVNKWSGPIPADVLESQAKVLAVKAFDTYDPSKGTALATHVTNNLLPLSRTVYTFQNTARIPEHIVMRLNAYNTAVNDFSLTHGREPTTEELHDRLGWRPIEITRVRDYNLKDLVESGADVAGRFYDGQNNDDEDDMVLEGFYATLDPIDKRIFENSTGFHGAPILKVVDIAKKVRLSVSQVAYRKTHLREKIEKYMQSPALARKYGR